MWLEVLARSGSKTADLIALLPPKMKALAELRFPNSQSGVEKEAVGRSLAHLRLELVGDEYRNELRALRGRRLGCFCDEGSPCHAKLLANAAARTQLDEHENGNLSTSSRDNRDVGTAPGQPAQGSSSGSSGEVGAGNRKRSRVESIDDE